MTTFDKCPMSSTSDGRVTGFVLHKTRCAHSETLHISAGSNYRVFSVPPPIIRRPDPEHEKDWVYALMIPALPVL